MAKSVTRTSSPAFTLIELLVVILIIALLVSITLVATTKALRAGQVAATTYLMQSISEGIEQFHSDFGYYPPMIRDDGHIIGPERTLLEAQPDSSVLFRTYRYFSVTTLPVYLVGVGRLEPTPSGGSPLDPDRHDGHAGPGFRDPGPDRSWGGAIDRANNRPTTSGRVYGPYVDFGDGEALRALRYHDFGIGTLADIDDNPRFVVESNFAGDRPDDAIYVIQDTWGVMIRYYQPRWRRRDPLTGALTLDNIPFELLNVDAINSFDPVNVGFQTDRDREILSAEYVLLSSGPNREFTGRTGFGQGSITDLSITPMDEDETNSDFFASIENEPGTRRDLLKAVGDNIRVIR